MEDQKIAEIINETAKKVAAETSADFDKKYAAQLAEAKEVIHYNAILNESLRSDFKIFGEGLSLLQDDVKELKKDMAEVKEVQVKHTFLLNYVMSEQKEMKEDISELKEDVKVLKEDVKQLDKKVDRIEKTVTIHDRKLAVA